MLRVANRRAEKRQVTHFCHKPVFPGTTDTTGSRCLWRKACSAPPTPCAASLLKIAFSFPETDVRPYCVVALTYQCSFVIRTSFLPRDIGQRCLLLQAGRYRSVSHNKPNHLPKYPPERSLKYKRASPFRRLYTRVGRKSAEFEGDLNSSVALKLFTVLCALSPRQPQAMPGRYSSQKTPGPRSFRRKGHARAE